MHQVKPFINILKRHCVSDKIVYVNFPFHIPVNNLRYISASLCTSKGCACVEHTSRERTLARRESRERKIDANHKTRKNKNVTATEYSSPTPRPPLSRPHHYLINPLLRQSFSSDSVHLLRAGTAAAVSKVRPAASWSFFSSAASTFSVHMTGGSSGFTLECPATPGLVPRSWSMTGSTPR